MNISTSEMSTVIKLPISSTVWKMRSTYWARLSKRRNQKKSYDQRPIIAKLPMMRTLNNSTPVLTITRAIKLRP